MMKKYIGILICLLCVLVACNKKNERQPLQIIFTNDSHSQVESLKGKGGFEARAAIIDMINKEHACHPLFMKMIGFVEIDWLYCINRSRRQAPTYRTDEVQAAIEKFATIFTDYLLSVDTKTDDGVNDLHMLFGAMCALAELQAALPGVIVTDKPLRLVLNRRPFI